MNTQTQNTRGIDYDNYPVINRDDGYFDILRPCGRRHNVYNDPEIARCDFRWYMERCMDSAYAIWL